MILRQYQKEFNDSVGVCSPGRVRFKDIMMRGFLRLDSGKLEVPGITRFIRCWLVL